jgi:hypothetical protein
MTSHAYPPHQSRDAGPGACRFGRATGAAAAAAGGAEPFVKGMRRRPGRGQHRLYRHHNDLHLEALQLLK